MKRTDSFIVLFFSRENFLKAPIRPETVKKLVVSGNVDDLSHRIYVQHLREIQAKREYQLQKIGHDEQAFLLADIQAHEEEQPEEEEEEQQAEESKNYLYTFERMAEFIFFHRNTSG